MLGLFSLCLGFAVYILVRYLVVKNKCEQMSMVVFYLLCIFDLASRMTYLLMSIFIDQVNTELYMVSQISNIASIVVGVVHSHNLVRLLFDLASVKCTTREQYEALSKRRIYFRVVFGLWLCLIIADLVILSLKYLAVLAFDNFISFVVLGI